ncbi:MAG: hypothetical protein DRQ51_01015 [Gammaproteobacteria bacterium]|nr:MAG: hypothetical protein DRQ51_01015 [Gammaproteobacteria bacterium]
MQIRYEKKLLKDIKKLNNDKLKQKLKTIFELFETQNTMETIQNIKKLKSHENYYRLKISDYRLGFHYQNNIITIIRILHRKDIYKKFP